MTAVEAGRPEPMRAAVAAMHDIAEARSAEQRADRRAPALQAHLRNKSAKESSAEESGTAQYPLYWHPAGLNDRSTAPDNCGKGAKAKVLWY